MAAACAPLGAVEPWPAESVGTARNLTAVEGPGTNDFHLDLSGLFWNPGTRVLWVCRNGPIDTTGSKFWKLVEDGAGGFRVDLRSGRRAEWTGFGDLEGITQADLAEADTVYLMVEGDERIKEYSVATYGTALLSNDWNTRPFLPTYTGGLGSEAITFVPDAWLEVQGFVDSAGRPYVSRNGMGGLMLVGHQNGGRVYAFDLDRTDGTFDFVGAYRTAYTEIAGLEFDRTNGILYIWHGDGFNLLEAACLSSVLQGAERRLNSLESFGGPVSSTAENLEGIAVSPAASGERWLFLTSDGGGVNGLRWFRQFDTGLEGHGGEDLFPPTIAVTLPPSPGIHLTYPDRVAFAGRVTDGRGVTVFTFLPEAGADTVAAVRRPSAALVPAGSVWRYLDDGSAPSAAWRVPGFDDSAWSSGPAQLGYGDGDEATEVRPGTGNDPSDKAITTYFRTTFRNRHPGAHDRPLLLRLLRDDGAAVYLNGVEVFRDNLPAGTLGAGTLASGTVGGAGESTFVETALPASALRPGENVLAVEVHQVIGTSSDISFDLELVSPGLVDYWYIEGGDLTGGTRYVLTARDAAGNEHEVTVTGLPVGARGRLEIQNAPSVVAENAGNAAVSIHRLGGSRDRVFADWEVRETGAGASGARLSGATFVIDANSTRRTVVFPVPNDGVYRAGHRRKLSFILKANSSDPEALGAVTVAQIQVAEEDSDGDGLPDDWERTHLGGLGSTPDGDADGDGWSNRFELIFGAAPNNPRPEPGRLPRAVVEEPVVVGGARRLTLAFSRSSAPGHARPVVEVAPAAEGPWTALPGPDEVAAPAADGFEQVLYRDPVPLSVTSGTATHGHSRFIRVRVVE